MPLKDKQKRNAYLRKWNSQNPEKVKQYSYTYLQNNPKKKLLKSAKYNARSRELEFSITEDDLNIPEYCPYLNIKLTSEISSKNNSSTISLDRIDSSKGYIPGNVQVISNLANRMKANASKEELLIFAKNVLKLYG